MEAVEFRGRVMASDLHVITLGATSTMVDEVMVLLDHLERCWSRFITTSDISRINLLPAGGALAVDDVTLTLLATMIEGHHVTGGRFDPTVLPALVREGYATSRVDPTRTTMLHHHDVAARLVDIEFDQLGGMVTVPIGLALDPGGIGKGLAADLAVAWLLDLGAGGALVSIGGDMAMAGDSPHPDGWTVGANATIRSTWPVGCRRRPTSPPPRSSPVRVGWPKYMPPPRSPVAARVSSTTWSSTA